MFTDTPHHCSFWCFWWSNQDEWEGRAYEAYWWAICAVFWWENLRERDHLQDLGVDDIKLYLQEVRWGHEWFDLAYDRARWQVFANAV